MGKITNPVTGYKIQVGGSTYNMLVKQGILRPSGQLGGASLLDEMRYNDISGRVEVFSNGKWKKATKAQENTFWSQEASGPTELLDTGLVEGQDMSADDQRQTALEGQDLEGEMRYNDISGRVEVFSNGKWKKATKAQETQFWSQESGPAELLDIGLAEELDLEGEMRYNDISGRVEVFSNGKWKKATQAQETQFWSQESGLTELLEIY